MSVLNMESESIGFLILAAILVSGLVLGILKIVGVLSISWWIPGLLVGIPVGLTVLAVGVATWLLGKFSR